MFDLLGLNIQSLQSIKIKPEQSLYQRIPTGMVGALVIYAEVVTF